MDPVFPKEMEEEIQQFVETYCYAMELPRCASCELIICPCCDKWTRQNGKLVHEACFDEAKEVRQ